MSLVRITDAATEPVTDAEVAAHLRLDGYTARPSSAPTAALSDPATPGDVDDGVHRYRCTFVTAAGETDGGRVSAPITIDDASVNGTVELTAIPIGGAGVTARKLYRTMAGGTEYFLVATIADNTTTEYSDDTADEDLGVGLPTTNATGADPMVAVHFRAARQQIEKECRHAFLEQTWALTLEDFPRACATRRELAILLKRLPVLSVDSVEYVDGDGETQTLVEDEDYLVDLASYPPRIAPAPGTSWPATRTQPGIATVTITFTAGHGTSPDDVDDDAKAAILLRGADLYRNREGQIIAVTVLENPRLAALLANYTYREFA